MSNNSLIIGLTGNIATGKSAVLHYLEEKGASIVDADKLAHRSMEPGTAAYRAILAQFGEQILNAEGVIDRGQLGRIVFADVLKLGQLEKIVHPAVFEMVKRIIETVRARIIVLEAVKLLEAGTMATLCDEIWVVISSPLAQLQRLMEKRGMTEDEARQRMQMQSPQAAKVNQADRVIENDGSLEQLYAQLDRIWEELQLHYAERLTDPVT